MEQRLRQIKEYLNNSDIGKRMVNGAFWSLTGMALAKGIVLIAGIACAHILGKKEYGEFGMVRSTINMFVTVAAAGLGTTATKYISEYKSQYKERIGSIYKLTSNFAIITGIIISLSIVLLASLLANKALHAPQLTNSIRIGAFLLFITVINGAQQGTLSGFENFKAIAINTLIGSITESTFMLIGAYFYHVIGAVLGFGIGFIAFYSSNRFSIKKTFIKHGLSLENICIKKNDWKLLYKFSLPSALTSLLIAPTYWIVRTMLVRFEGFGELAIYEAADQWRIIILFIPIAVSGIVLPILSSLVNEDKKKFWKVLRYNLIANISISFIIVIFVCAFSGYIMHLYGDDYTNKTPLILLSFSTIFNSAAAVIGLSISSRAKMWTGFGFNLLWGLMFIGLSFIFLQNGLSTEGISLALLISYIIHSILQFLYLRKIINK